MSKSLLAALALAGAALGAPAQTTWKVATPFPASSVHTETLMQFAQEVERASEGKMKIRVQPDAALKAPEVKRAVQKNTAQLGDVALAELQTEWPGYGPDSIPFLASGYGAARKLYQAQRVSVGKRLSGQGLVMLYSVPSAPVGLFVKKPVADLAELRGLAWSAYSPGTERMARLVGARPVALAEAQLPRAVKAGELQAALVPAEAFDVGGAEPSGVFMDLQAWVPRHGLLMNLQAFEALDQPLRKAVVKAALAAEKRGWEQSEARHRRALARLKDLGLEVTEPPPALRTALHKTVGEPMLNDWLQRAGPEGKLLIDDYRR